MESLLLTLDDAPASQSSEMPQSTANGKTVLVHNKRSDQARRMPVNLPHIFDASFGVTSVPRVNPLYERMRKESEEWLEKSCCLSKSTMKHIHDHNFVYFGAIVAPDSPVEEFRLMSDWMVWIFAYDDMFDEGHLRSNIEAAANSKNNLLATMSLVPGSDSVEPLPSIIQAHAGIWKRLKEQASIGVQQRFAKAMSDYVSQVFNQVRAQGYRKLLTVDELLAERAESIGVKPLNALAENCYHLQIPDEVFQHWTIQKIEQLASELVAIQNEIVSYRKEEREDARHNVVVCHNLIGILRQSGMSAQEAFDHAGSMLVTRYREWGVVMSALPSWGPRVDRDVRVYIQINRNQVSANANWSFLSTRYFGEQRDVVNSTLVTDVLLDPPYRKSHVRGNGDIAKRVDDKSGCVCTVKDYETVEVNITVEGNLPLQRMEASRQPDAASLRSLLDSDTSST